MRRLTCGAMLLLTVTLTGCGGVASGVQNRVQNYAASPGETTVSKGHTQSIPAPSSNHSSSDGSGATADFIAKLHAKGWNAKLTGEKIQPLFGAKSAEVVNADGIAVQAYVFADAVAAETAFKIASNPQAHMVQWAASPHFVNWGNLLITIITDDEQAAKKLTEAVQNGSPNTATASGQTKVSNAHTQSIPAPASAGSSSDNSGITADLIAKLQANGVKAKLTGEMIQPLFGAKSAEVVNADGIAVQAYVFADAVGAETAFKIASNPQAHMVQWAAQPHFVKTKNVLVTIITDDEAAATKISGALQP